MFKSNVLPISLQLIDLILELFLQCGIFYFVFILYIKSINCREMGKTFDLNIFFIDELHITIFFTIQYNNGKQ
jgi:hypothetical protein